MKMCKRLAWVSVLLCATAIADEAPPRWELGIGAYGLSLPAYRGAEQRQEHLLPLPYIQYRGERLRWSRDGGRLRLLGADRARLELSLGASPPSDTDGDSPRRGMPDLDPTVELGAQLEVLLHQSEERRSHWVLAFPVRKVVAIGSGGLESAGWVFSPYVQYQRSGVWKTTIAAGPLFGSEGYHDYFYQVNPAFATATRPVYDADAGYSGSRVTVGVSRRMGNYWIGAFARYDYLGGARFDDSPLVETDHSLMVGAGIAWIFAESKARGAPAREPW